MSEWDEYAADWDDDPAVVAYASAAFESLNALIDGTGVSLDGAAVCDFGCGTGRLTERLAAVAGRIDAVDTSAAMCDVLRSKAARAGWDHVRVFEELPEPGSPEGDRARYDLIVCSSVLSFVDDYPVTVAMLGYRLVDGGLFVQWDWELDPADEQPHGFSRDEIALTLREAGLTDVRVERAFEIDVGGSTMRPLRGSGRRPGGSIG